MSLPTSARSGGAPPADRAVRMLLVDDHPVVRQGLRMLIESMLACEVVEAGSAAEAVQAAQSGAFDLVLLDARLPGHDGLWALRRIREARPALPVLMVSTYDSEDYVEGSLDAGAAGYLLKEATAEQLGEAIDVALSGHGIYLHPIVAQRILAHQRHGASVEALSEREMEVLSLLAEGATNQEIAARLYLTEKTVKSHLSRIFRKLAVSNRTQAAAKAIREHVVLLP